MSVVTIRFKCSEYQANGPVVVLDAPPPFRRPSISCGRRTNESLLSKSLLQGMMSGLELSQAYASADVFVMPSESETLGFVVLEAMASGLPVVAVAAGGLTDILTQPGVTGLLYPPGDLEQAGWAVAALLRDPELQQKVSQSAPPASCP